MKKIYKILTLIIIGGWLNVTTQDFIDSIQKLFSFFYIKIILNIFYTKITIHYNLVSYMKLKRTSSLY